MSKIPVSEGMSHTYGVIPLIVLWYIFDSGTADNKSFSLFKTGYFKGDNHDESDYLGGRMSTSDGTCKSLYHEWELNEAVGRRYANFKYISIKEEFKPALISGDPLRTTVFYRVGAKITATFRTEEKVSTKTNILFTLGGFSVSFRNNRVMFGNNLAVDDNQKGFVVDTRKMCEVSFLVETNEVKVYVNGVKMGKIHKAVQNKVRLEINTLRLDTRIILYSVRIAQDGSFYPE